MPSNHLIGRLVICFVTCAPWNISGSLVHSSLVVHNVFIILGPLFVLLLILVVESMVKLSVSPLVVQVIHQCLVVGSPIESAALLSGRLAHALASSSKTLGSRRGFLVKHCELLLFSLNLLLIIVNSPTDFVHAVDVHITPSVVLCVIKRALRTLVD